MPVSTSRWVTDRRLNRTTRAGSTQAGAWASRRGLEKRSGLRPWAARGAWSAMTSGWAAAGGASRAKRGRASRAVSALFISPRILHGISPGVVHRCLALRHRHSRYLLSKVGSADASLPTLGLAWGCSGASRVRLRRTASALDPRPQPRSAHEPTDKIDADLSSAILHPLMHFTGESNGEKIGGETRNKQRYNSDFKDAGEQQRPEDARRGALGGLRGIASWQRSGRCSRGCRPRQGRHLGAIR